ncbi:exonuclease [Mesobaculum littorinae]|uniref:Exonuclease n=1 Tax=Mesobaculum littorinae TaxID=2486419 RepID=A0A438AFE2_9RHOB|nr:exonuclease domain-containing protein [Mesobaculum littorinae]RVV97315.1 exonuclease [Mesobaculum littorinae]
MLKRLFHRRPPTNELEELEAILANTYRFVAVDVETANSHPGSICQIGLACVGDAGVDTVVTLLIDPRCQFDRMNISIHGIEPAHVDGKTTFAEFLDLAEDFLARHSLMQHSSFDGRAIRCATEDCGRAPRPLQWHDSVLVARRAWPEFRGNGGHGLSHLKTALGLSFRHHDAGEDARASAEVTLQAEALTGKLFHEILAKPAATRGQKPVAKAGA